MCKAIYAQEYVNISSMRSFFFSSFVKYYVADYSQLIIYSGVAIFVTVHDILSDQHVQAHNFVMVSNSLGSELY